MKKLCLLLLLVLVVAVGSTLGTQYWMLHRDISADSTHEDHAWLHRQLQVTPGQEAKLAPAEKLFAENETSARARLAEANRELALALNKNNTYTPEVAAAVDGVHHAQSELQKVVLEHYFELLAVLTPEQAAKLRKLVQDGLAPGLAP